MKAILALEDGTVFVGTAFGATGERYGEVVFNTSMTGYQEILTDPSYKGQIVTMTYPLIGNYGINDEDTESAHPQVEGFVVREVSRIASNWRSQKSLVEYLQEHQVVGIEGIDTRALTRHIRTAGAMKAVLSTDDLDEKRLVQKARDSRGLVGIDLVQEVTCASPYSWNEFIRSSAARDRESRPEIETFPYRVVAIDCGIKYNILRLLRSAGCDVTVVPATTTAQEIAALKPKIQEVDAIRKETQAVEEKIKYLLGLFCASDQNLQLMTELTTTARLAHKLSLGLDLLLVLVVGVSVLTRCLTGFRARLGGLHALRPHPGHGPQQLARPGAPGPGGASGEDPPAAPV
jgi:carbamoyl-phosphate synthase small subunit